MEDLREITEMRQMLECHALRQSIANADLDWEARLVGAYHKLSKVEALVEAEPELYGEAWERYNQEFHEALIANCQSRWLKVFHRAMYDHSQRYRMLSLEDQALPEIAIGRGASANSRRGDPHATFRRPSGFSPAHILKGAEMTGLEPGEASGRGRALQRGQK